MSSGIGIPDSSPESTVTAIKHISQEFAEEFGGTCRVREELKELSTHVTLDFTVHDHGLRIVLRYVKSHDLRCAASSGDGIIWPVETQTLGRVGEKLLLELECEETNSRARFWWRYYPEKPQLVGDYDKLNVIPQFQQPSDILDRSTLRAQLRERLLLAPRE